MRKSILPLVLGLALVLNACNKTSDVNPTSPTVSNSAAVQLFAKLNLSNEQYAQIDQVFYMDQDMSMILDDQQVSTVNELITMFTPSDSSGRVVKHYRVIDFDAMMYFRLILQANPDLTDEQKQAIIDLIMESNKTRMNIILENMETNPDAIAELLKAEHDKLIAAINDLIGPDAVQKVEELKAKIEQERLERQQKMIERMVDRQVAMYTRYLGLDSTQAAAIKQILLNQQEQIAALRTQYAGDPEGFRAALKELQTKTEEQIKALLTEEQLKLWEAMKNRVPGGGGTGGGRGGHHG
jgi:Spy/CpxP family protein refolding chaperone